VQHTGGGYVLGSCNQQLSTVAATAAAANLTIICPEYGLAPEHPFPAGLNDAVSVYKDLLKQGYQGKNILLLGDSAGGGLVPAIAIQLQNEGVALPAALGMFSPFADMRNRGDSTRIMAGVDPLLLGFNNSTRGNDMDGLTAVYLANNASNLNNPLASPIEGNYTQLFPNSTLPPTLIQVGLRDTLLSDAVRLYHKMKAAAPAPGRVVLSPYEGMWHVFQMFYYVPEAQAASKEMADYFTRALNGRICK
jgi:acetyl esterase/lipase